MDDLPLVPSFGKPNALEPGRKSRRTYTIAKQQPHFKGGEAIAKHDVFGQLGAKEKKMHMKKPNEKLISEKRPKRGKCLHSW